MFLLGIYGILRFRSAPRLALAGFCAVLVALIYFVHARQMMMPISELKDTKGQFASSLGLSFILLLPSMLLLVISTALKDIYLKYFSGLSIVLIVVLGLVLRYPYPIYEQFGFVDVVIMDFDTLGYIPLPIIYEFSQQVLYAVLAIVCSMLVLIAFIRLLVFKSSDWLRFSPQTIIPAVVVFLSSFASFYVHRSNVDFTQMMDLTQLASFSVAMAWCVSFNKSIREGSPGIKAIVGGAAIGFYASCLMQLFNIPIIFKASLDIFIILSIALVILGYLIFVFYNYIASFYEAELEMSREERLAAIGRLASSTAHEIRNPLQAIRGLSQLLFTNTSDKESKEILDVVVKETDHLDVILRRLLDYSRELKLNLEDINILDWWGNLKTIIEEMCASKKVKCVYNNPPDVKAMFDSERIRQVVINLLKNAVEESQEHGNIYLNLSADRVNLKIRVQDEGKGISSDDAEKVFKEFYTTKAEGSGLGLPISKGIVEAHGGKIYFDLSVKKGATVVVLVPLKPPKRILRRYMNE